MSPESCYQLLFYSIFEQFYWHLFKSDICIGHNGAVLCVDLPAGKIGCPVSKGAVSGDGVVAVGQDGEVLADAVRVVAVAATGEEHVAGVVRHRLQVLAAPLHVVRDVDKDLNLTQDKIKNGPTSKFAFRGKKPHNLRKICVTHRVVELVPEIVHGVLEVVLV